MQAEQPEAFSAAEDLIDDLPLPCSRWLAVHCGGMHFRAEQIAVVELIPVAAHRPLPVRDDPSQRPADVKAEYFISISSPGRTFAPAG